MEYNNLHTGVRINLGGLTKVEEQFYRQALRRFRENTNWPDFDDFAFGMRSRIYAGRRSHLEVLKHPLYLALKDMSLQLGVQQGRIAGRDEEGRKAIA